MPKRKRAALVKLSNLPSLQNLIRRDPPAYREEFMVEYRHYASQRDIFMSQPDHGPDVESFVELIDFITHVADSYPDLASGFPSDVINLLVTNHANLEPELRVKLVQSLELLRKKDVLKFQAFFETLFPLLTTTSSKELRRQIYKTILADIRHANAKHTSHVLNRHVQSLLYDLVSRSSVDASAGLWAVRLSRALWKKGVWSNNAKVVDIMRLASISDTNKVSTNGCKFFLGVDNVDEEEDGDDDDEPLDLGALKHRAGVTKKTSKRKAQLDRAVANLKRREKNKVKNPTVNFSALHLLHDPQGFAEALFSKHLSSNSTNLTFDQKLVVMNLVSRLIGVHQLNLLSFYSYVLKYLTPRQRDVTSVLAYCAQASHPLVPPDDLAPVITKIANEFVSDGVASEVATAGLNAIREICTRAPHAMTDMLLQDLTEYKGSKDKGVMMAARGLIGLFREVAPEMLKKQDRGKDVSIAMNRQGKHGLRWGEEQEGRIEGLELYETWKADQKKTGDGEEGSDIEDGGSDDDGWGQWEEDDEGSESGSWRAVSSDGEAIDMSDTSDDEQDQKRQKVEKIVEEQVVGEPADEPTAVASETLAESFSTLATTTIITPAQWAKIRELRAEAEIDEAIGNKNGIKITDDAVDTTAIEGPKFGKADKEARIASIKEGREDRTKYSSKKGKMDKPHSTTNKEKARKKNFLMTLGKAKAKGKRSLVQQQKILQNHGKRQKMGK